MTTETYRDNNEAIMLQLMQGPSELAKLIEVCSSEADALFAIEGLLAGKYITLDARGMFRRWTRIIS
jgi:hypothetical protein